MTHLKFYDYDCNGIYDGLNAAIIGEAKKIYWRILMNNLKAFLKQVTSYKKHHVVALICLALSAITTLIMPIINTSVFDNAIANKDLELLITLISIYILIAILDKVLRFFTDYQYVIISRKLVTDLKVQLFDKLHTLSGDFFSHEKSGNISTLINEDISIIQNIASKTLFQMLSEIIIAIPLSIYMFSIDKQLFLLIIVPLPVFFVLQYYFINRTEKEAKMDRKSISKLNVILHEFLSSSMTNIIIGASAYFKSNYKNQAKQVESNVIKYSFTTLLRSFAISSMLTIITILFILFGGYKVINNTITIGALMTMYQYSTRIVLPIFKIADFISELKVTMVSLNRIYDIWNKPSCIHDGNIKLTEITNIDFEEISFKYNEDQEQENLKNISLSFKKNTFTALVGDSGSGKSTLINLLMKLWNAESGCIKINNYNIDVFNTQELRSQISVVSQQNVLFNDTIFNNITLLKNENKEEVFEVCKKLGIHEFIVSLPHGYNTNIGDNGIKLSGGQKQRLAIARAILKKSSVLIFDESTSNLDTISEEKVVEYIQEVSKEKIVIFIAHRLSTITNANYIYVFKNGGIVEQGTHKELININKHYCKLFVNGDTVS